MVDVSDVVLAGPEAVPVLLGSKTVMGIFRSAYSAAKLMGTDVESELPYVLIRESDAAGLKQRDKITIGGTGYLVRERMQRNDGLTGIKLTLDDE